MIENNTYSIITKHHAMVLYLEKNISIIFLIFIFHDEARIFWFAGAVTKKILIAVSK